VGATRVGGGAATAAAAVSGGGRGQLGRVAEQRGMLRESQREGDEAVGWRGGDAWRLGEAGGGLGRRGTTACGGAATRQRKKKGGARG
jgi:hypothetical protein